MTPAAATISPIAPTASQFTLASPATYRTRRSAPVARASTNRGISEQRNEINLRFGLDPAAMDLLLRGAQPHSDLEPNERLRYTLLMRAVIGLYADVYVQFREGICDSETWELAKVTLRPILSTPGVAAWWEENRKIVRSGFRSEVDALVRDAPPNKAMQLT